VKGPLGKEKESSGGHERSEVRNRYDKVRGTFEKEGEDPRQRKLGYCAQASSKRVKSPERPET